MRIPRELAEAWRHEPDWLEDLPRLAAECSEMWDLRLEPPLDTPRSLVIPAGKAVLKLNAPSHFEADHEAEALARWEGVGAVRLLARDDSRRALLCERCRPGTRLWDAGVDETIVVTELLGRLSHKPASPHPFRFLADEARRWAEEAPTRYEIGGMPFERSLIEVAVDVFRSVDDRAAYLVNQDLHGANILQAEREPWLVIDPKPLVGEREMDGVGLLRNAVVGGTSSVSARRWLDVLHDFGLDRERLRGWGVAHALAWGWNAERGWSTWSIDVARAILAA
jgi:streptomycin 6-kinase